MLAAVAELIMRTHGCPPLLLQELVLGLLLAKPKPTTLSNSVTATVMATALLPPRHPPPLLLAACLSPCRVPLMMTLQPQSTDCDSF